jgi:hypothetical protein
VKQLLFLLLVMGKGPVSGRTRGAHALKLGMQLKLCGRQRTLRKNALAMAMASFMYVTVR